MNGQRAVIHRPRSEGIPPVPADRPLECGGSPVTSVPTEIHGGWCHWKTGWRRGPDAALDWDRPKTKAPSPRRVRNPTPVPRQTPTTSNTTRIWSNPAALPAHSKGSGKLFERPKALLCQGHVSAV